MEKIRFSLDSGSSNKLIKWFQLFFGIICLATSVASLFIFPGPVKSGLSFWITFLFISGFGLYQINSGVGRGSKFITIGENEIVIKKTSVFPQKKISSGEIERIKVMPLSIIFSMKEGKKNIFRFGTTYSDNINPVRNAIIAFAKEKNIPFEIGKEEF